jgi:hypothetical protein
MPFADKVIHWHIVRETPRLRLSISMETPALQAFP